MHVRVCPQCGEEYRPEIVACADCGVDLVDADDEAPLATGAARVAPAPEEPGDTEPARILLGAWFARDLVPAADELAAAGVPFRLVSPPTSQARQRPYYTLIVPESAAEEALRVLAPLVEQNPDLSYNAAPAPLGEAQAVSPATTCPACEAHVPAGARECPACSLSFYREDDEG
jgi:hypothetical protein